jgi:type IV pilus assembly protein PilA
MRACVHEGFSLIELMIAVAIVGLLASVALPAYQIYVARTQVAEAVVLLSRAKAVVSEYAVDSGRMPDIAAVVTRRSRYVANIEQLPGAGSAIAEDSQVAVRAVMRTDSVGSAVRGLRIYMISEDGARTWTCSNGRDEQGVDPRYLPAICR